MKEEPFDAADTLQYRGAHISVNDIPTSEATHRLLILTLRVAPLMGGAEAEFQPVLLDTVNARKLAASLLDASDTAERLSSNPPAPLQ